MAYNVRTGLIASTLERKPTEVVIMGFLLFFGTLVFFNVFLIHWSKSVWSAKSDLQGGNNEIWNRSLVFFLVTLMRTLLSPPPSLYVI